MTGTGSLLIAGPIPFVKGIGATEEIRTPANPIDSGVLYQTELQPHS